MRNINLFGNQLCSSNLIAWNFGAIEQKFDLTVYKTILWERLFQNNVGSILGALLIIITLFFAQKKLKNNFDQFSIIYYSNHAVSQLTFYS